jgi:hypothetical protein
MLLISKPPFQRWTKGREIRADHRPGPVILEALGPSIPTGGASLDVSETAQSFTSATESSKAVFTHKQGILSGLVTVEITSLTRTAVRHRGRH